MYVIDATAVTTTYNILGNVSGFMDYDGSGTTYTRDAEGRVTKESHSDGSTTEYAYNAAGQLTMQKEVTANNTTRRQIAYAYDDAGNLTSENRSGVDIDKKDELVRYYYDAADRLIKTSVEGVITDYSYDKAGNLLSDGAYTYTYDRQNRLLNKVGTDGTTSYTYDAAGNLIKETGPDGTTTYTYSAQNKLVLGETDDGQSSAYTYNAMGARIENTQVRENQNVGYQNSSLTDGSSGVDYTDYLKDFRASLQRVWETEVGTTVQNNYETVTKHYVVDYLSVANRDILVTEDGSFTQRYVYDAGGTRVSAEFDYADGTRRGESGENLQSDFAANDIQKVWYRTSLVSSTLFAVDKTGAVISHMIYDPWGNPLTETYTDTNLSGIDNLNNYTGYTWDETLGLYYAQNRFYDAKNHRFTQEDTAKDGANWYVYCGNNPLNRVDVTGLAVSLTIGTKSYEFADTSHMYDAAGTYVKLTELIQILSKVYSKTTVSYNQYINSVSGHVNGYYYSIDLNSLNKLGSGQGRVHYVQINYFDVLVCSGTTYVNLNQFLSAAGLASAVKVVDSSTSTVSYSTISTEAKKFLATVAGESMSCIKEEQMAVASTIINRYKHTRYWKNQTIDEILIKNQYNAVGGTLYTNAMNYMNSGTVVSEVNRKSFDSMATYIYPIYRDKGPDYADGATYFKGDASPASWLGKEVLTGKGFHHHFFRATGD